MMLLPYHLNCIHKKTLNNRIAECFVLRVFTEQGNDAKGERNVAATAQANGNQGRQII